MSQKSWSHAGCVLFNAARVYYLPEERALPPLRWLPEKQQFIYLDCRQDEDVVLRTTLEEFAEGASRLPPLHSDQQLSLSSLSGCVPCQGLYGILRLGSSHSALLYITERQYAGSIVVEAVRHAIYTVVRLEWIFLPSKTPLRRRLRSSQRNSNDGAGSELDGTGELEKDGEAASTAAAACGDGGVRAIGEPQRRSSDQLNPATGSTSSSSGEEEEEEAEMDEEDEDDETELLSAKTLHEYLTVLDKFCRSVSESSRRTGEMGGLGSGASTPSYLFFSPTINLSLDAAQLALRTTFSPMASQVSRSTRKSSATAAATSDPQRPANQWSSSFVRSEIGVCSVESFNAARASQQVFQWNYCLIRDGFLLPSISMLQEELNQKLRRRRGNSIDAIVDGDSDYSDAKTLSSLRAPWGGVVLTAENIQPMSCSFASSGIVVGSAVRLATTAALYFPCVIRGLIAQEEAPEVSVTLLTRLSCRWAGTRYNRRGLEPGSSGVVANMAATAIWMTPRADQMLFPAALPQKCAVFTILRGSVPRRWDQPANLSLKPTVKLFPTYSVSDEIGRHVRLLKRLFPHVTGVCCLDTMSTSRLEDNLSDAYATAVRRYTEDTTTSTVRSGSGFGEGDAAEPPSSQLSVALPNESYLSYFKFNVKAAMATQSYTTMLEHVADLLDSPREEAESWLDFTRLSCEESSAGEAAMDGQWMVRPQKRLVRVNCLDCLDRTNVIQSMVAVAMVPKMLQYLRQGSSSSSINSSGAAKESETGSGTRAQVEETAMVLRRLFVAQGIAVSRLYAGSYPHFIDYTLTGERSSLHKMNEGWLALRRWYQQNFFDGAKQDGVSLVTRQHDPEVFNADIESPFSRDLSGMNRQVFSGLLLAICPFLYSVVMCLLSPSYSSSTFRLHLIISFCWVAYLEITLKKLMKYRVTYTNRPLLLYTRQPEATYE